MTPSHYLNQCWLIINLVQWQLAMINFRQSFMGIYSWYWFENEWIKIIDTSCKGQWVKPIYFTHWGLVTHICVGKLTTIGSENGLSPGRRQAIIWTNAGILLIGPYGTNFSEISIKILTFSFTKISLKVSSAKWRPFCLSLNVLRANELNQFT